MQDDDKKVEGGTSIQAGGDVIGVDVKGNKNIIGKHMNVTQTNTENQVVTINENILSKLDENYAKAFKQVEEGINNQIKQSTDIEPEQVSKIQNSLEDLAKETEGLKPGEQPPEEKKKTWKEKFKAFAKYAVKALPKTAATLALFTPITAPFSKEIEEGLDHVVEGIQAAMD